MGSTRDSILATTRKMDTKLKSFVINTLRRASFRWKPRGESKKRYKVKVGEYSTGRAKYGYKCAACEGIYKSGEIKMDHIDPAVPLDGWQGFDVFIERLFCDEDGFQALCPGCHDEKTGIEREERKTNRELKKRLDKDKEV